MRPSGVAPDITIKFNNSMQSKTIHQAAPSNHYGEAIDFKETLKASEALVSEA